MNLARYILAMMLLLALPPALLWWVAIHPFAAWWRKYGVWRTYAILSVPACLWIATILWFQKPLLEVDYGFDPNYTAVALLCLIAAMMIQIRRRKHLTHRILIGTPELSQNEYPGTLLTEGIYGRIRHPRYVELTLIMLGYALIANYLSVYILFGMSIPVLYIVVVLEERELRQRFGEAYTDYSENVPRFIPRLRKQPSND